MKGVDPHPVSSLAQRRLDVLEQLLRLPGGDMKTTLSHASDAIARVSASDKVDAFLYDPARDSLVAVGTSTQPLSALQRQHGLDVLPLANGGCTVHAFRTGETFYTGNLEDEAEELRGVKDVLRVRSTIAVALEIGGERRGLLLLASQKPQFFTEDDARFMETVAPWIGLVAHRAELAAEIARNATEAGRRAGAEELITVLAHDLRNYIAPINMRLNVLRLRAQQERREDELRDIDLLGRSVDRLGELVTDILDVSRIDQGVFRIQPRRIELSGLVREVVATFESAQNTIKLTIQQGDNMVISGDPPRLRQCLENVLANAIQKSPASGTVNVFVRKKEPPLHAALVEIIDEGPGIPAEQIAHIFERFQTDRTEGLGLGLYLAKRIARIHGGDLTAASEPGHGARFILTLPALAPDV
jgi:two-component system, OmpR family, sensor kinase